MLSLIKNNRLKYIEVVRSNLADYSYRDKRYHIEFAIAIGLSDDKINHEIFKNAKRKTDEFIELEENLCCIIFDCAPPASAIKATSNLQAEFQSKNFNKKLFTAVVTSKDYDNEITMLHSLFDILDYAIVNNMDNMVIDKSQMVLQNH